ncbi:MAG: sigma-70 family RNA polymerase sigma factor [Planctomycetota bacterium]|nr:sigma-70 family RNA polymerase sigma factor [Planctomycetota bacterium]
MMSEEVTSRVDEAADDPEIEGAVDESASEVEPEPPQERPTPQSLIENNQGLVISLAKQIHSTLPKKRVDIEDLIGYGQIGLAEAARIFNPDLNVKFSTYSYYRIRGAIFDGLSKMAWFAKARRNDANYQRNSNDLLQTGAEAQVDDNAESQSRWFGNMTRTLAVAYLTTHRDGEDDSSVEIVDESAQTPGAAASDLEISEKLVELIDTLPEEAQTLIRATYFEGATLQEAGQRLGISKSWASRLHARALSQLGRALKSIGVD